MANDVWCFHSHPPLNPAQRLEPGQTVVGRVVCVHPFGVGCILSTCEGFGHVNVTEFGRATSAGMADYPGIGETLVLEVLGYTGKSSQLRLRVRS